MFMNEIEPVYQLQKRAGILPGWVKDERLEYCDGGLSFRRSNKGGRRFRYKIPGKQKVFSFLRATASLHSAAGLFALWASKRAVRPVR